MSKWSWDVAGDETRWTQARIIARAECNDLDMVDAVAHIKEVAT